jgi:hypothetical protein
MNRLDLEFSATDTEPYRYPLEKNGHGRNRERCKRDRVHADTFERYEFFMKPKPRPKHRALQQGSLC